MTGPGLVRASSTCAGKWLSQLVKSSIFAQYSSSLQAGEAKRPLRLKLSTSALARKSLLTLFASRGRARSALSSVFTNHTIPITRSRTPPRAPASTYPQKKRPARPGAPRPTALRRTCPRLRRGSPLPRVHGPTLLLKQTRPNLQQSPSPIKRARRRPRTHIRTTKRRVRHYVNRTCARDGG